MNKNMIAYKEILNQIQSYDYVSFDIYDTLILRTVHHYEDVFDEVSRILETKYNFNLRNFKRLRLEADIKARKATDCDEVTIKQIYNFMPYESEVRDVMMREEINYEIRHTIGNELMIYLLNECRNKGKKIIITSDMYLPQNVIEKILKIHNIKYDFLFLSNTYGVTKRSGKLFDVVLKSLRIKEYQIVHIGDDKNNDIDVPYSKGIKAIESFYSKNINAIRYLKKYLSITEEINKYYLVNKIKADCNFTTERRIGYYLLGMFVLSWCEWIHTITKEKYIDKLFFIAREGYLLKQCYDVLYPNEDTIYIRLNKNLLRLPSINSKHDVYSFINSIPVLEKYNWEQILDYFYVQNKQEFVIKAKKKGIDLSLKKVVVGSKLREGSYDNEIQYIINEIWEEVIKQKSFLKSYLTQCGLYGYTSGLVNNSANGNAQVFLTNFLNNVGEASPSLIGLQLIQTQKCKSVLGGKAISMIPLSYSKAFLSDMLHRNSLVIEHLLFEPSGTALYFEKKNNLISPVCEARRKEILNDDLINKIQRYAIEFIKDYKKYGLPGIGPEGILPFVDFLQNPIKEDAIAVCSIYNDDVEGDRKIADENLKLDEKFFIHDYICWVEGFLKMKGASDRILKKFTAERKKMVIRNYFRATIVSLSKSFHLYSFLKKLFSICKYNRV